MSVSAPTLEKDPARGRIIAPAVAGVGSQAAVAGQWVLECLDLTKQFGTFTAVSDLTFRLKAGEVLGFLGPNGAGKSTTVGMILGLIRPTKGTVKIAGTELTRDPSLVAEHVGAIIENPAFYPYMSGRDNLRALAIAAGDVEKDRIDVLLKLVNMHDRADKKYKTFSLGMKQRLGIAATLLTNPALVILDEPTNGLDPAGQREIREIIPRLAEEGHAVLLASHMLHEVEQVSDRIAIVRKGQMIKEGNVDELLETGSYVETVVPPQDLDTAVRTLEGLPFVDRVMPEDGGLKVYAPEDSGQAINRALVERGIYASVLAPKRNTLEDLFLDLTEEPGVATD
jgi:ABC-2 type transport system ATP-binding protein